MVPAPIAMAGDRCDSEDDQDDDDEHTPGQTKLKFKRTLDGLGDKVRFTVKHGPIRGWALGASTKRVSRNGKRVSIRELEVEEAAAAFRRYGALDADSFERLSRLPQGQPVDFMLLFALPGASRATSVARDDGEAIPVQTLLTATRVAVRATAAPLLTSIAANGGQSLRAASSFPAIFGRATPRDLRRIARLAPGLVQRVTLRGEARGHLVTLTPPSGSQTAVGRFPNSASDANLDCTFNKAGLSAQDVLGDDRAIGIFEEAYAALWEGHDALSFARVEYQSEPVDCVPVTIGTVKNTANICQDICFEQNELTFVDGFETNAPVCLPLGDHHRCTCGHSSGIASIVSSTFASPANRLRPRAAASARILFANGQPGFDPKKNQICDPERAAAAYDWMVAANASVSIEPWICDASKGEVDGVVQDFYAERFGILPFRSSGDAKPTNSSALTACTSANSVCVGSTTFGAVQMAYASTSTNPKDSDREEPDIVAFGEGVSMMDLISYNGVYDNCDTCTSTGKSPGTPHRWRQADGTSFSAPVAATLGFLAQKTCAIGGQFDTAIGLRSAMRAAGWARNVVGPAESPAGGSYQDGGGSPVAESVMLFCEHPLPTWSYVAPETDLFRVHRVLTTDVAVSAKSPSWLLAGDDRRAQPVLDLVDERDPLQSGVLHADDHVRLAASWNTCVASPKLSSLSLPPDLDIFLCAESLGGCVASSESWYDTNEVFDIHVPSDIPFANDWKVWVAADPGTRGCDGSSAIPISISVVWGPSQAFSVFPTNPGASCADQF